MNFRTSELGRRVALLSLQKTCCGITCVTCEYASCDTSMCSLVAIPGILPRRRKQDNCSNLKVQGFPSPGLKPGKGRMVKFVYLKSESRNCGAALAWANIAVAVCCKISSLLAFTCSSAMLAFMMRLYEASRLICAEVT